MILFPHKVIGKCKITDIDGTSNYSKGSVDFNTGKKFVTCMNSDSDNKIYLNSSVDCEYQTNTRNDPIIPSYQSLFIGVRPQMSKAEHQKGITQLEIRTQCVVEFQMYFAVPTVLDLTDNTEDFVLDDDHKHTDTKHSEAAKIVP